MHSQACFIKANKNRPQNFRYGKITNGYVYIFFVLGIYSGFCSIAEEIRLSYRIAFYLEVIVQSRTHYFILKKDLIFRFGVID